MSLPKLLFVALFMIVLSSCQNKMRAINDMSLMANGKIELFHLSKDGNITIRKRQLGTLSENGELKNQEGKVLATLDSKGLVRLEGTQIAAIADNGDISTREGKSFNWNKEGKLILTEKEFMTIDPNDPKLRRAASYIFVVYSIAAISSSSKLPQ